MKRLKDLLSIPASDVTNDELLSTLIMAASGLAETYCQRSLLQDTYTSQRLNGAGDVYLLLPEYPLIGDPTEIKIDTVVITKEASDGDGGWFVSDANGGEIYYPGGFPLGVGNLRISYTAGYRQVPDEVEQAVQSLARHYYEHNEDIVLQESQGGVSFQYAQAAIPEPIKGKLRPYRKPPSRQ